MNTFLATPAAFGDYDPEAERQHGPPNHLCHIYAPCSKTELLVMDCELEEFEKDTGVRFTDDTPHPRTWRRLLRWLMKNIGLFDVTRNLEIRQSQTIKHDYEI